MKPYYEDSHCTIYHGDCREVLPTLAPGATCITDPPYGLSFMGKDWDHGVPGEHFWRLISDALVPGAMCLAFGGTRTHHRLMCGIEDAGFELRDCMMWLYGSGFPKSLDVGKAIDKAAGAENVVGTIPDRWTGKGNALNFATDRPQGTCKVTTPATGAAKLWDGWGTALKPAWEPIIVAMKPLDGTFADNAQKHGVAGLNVDGARIGTEVGLTNHTRKKEGTGVGWHPESTGETHDNGGRWPANLVLDEDAAAMLDEQSGELTSGAFPSRREGIGYTKGGGGTNAGTEGPRRDMNTGGASRFFYTAKASRSDRGENNDHPTVKPSDLMKWLCTLTSAPTGGTILDPFMGSGTTLYAAKEMNRKALGIDLDEKHCEIAAQRLSQEVLAL